MSEANHGTITIVVGGRSYTLLPTLEAALRIEARFGGLRGALESLRLLSIASAADIVVAGAGLKQEAHGEVAAAVFSTGVSKVCAELTPYIAVLLNPVPPSVVEQGKPEGADTAQ